MLQRDEAFFDLTQLDERDVRLIDSMQLDPLRLNVSTGHTKFVRQAKEIADSNDAGMIIQRALRWRQPDQTLKDHPQLAEQEDAVRLAVSNGVWRDFHRELIRPQLAKQLSQRRGAAGIVVNSADQGQR